MSENINEQIECCDCNEIHKEDSDSGGVAKYLKKLCKVVELGFLRHCIIYYFQKIFVLFEAEVCVCDLAKVLNMTQSAISHQLRILKANKLVNSRREGKSVFYSLADGHVRTIIAQGREHIEE